MWCVIYKKAYYTIGEWSASLPSYYCSQVFLFYLYPDTGEIKVKTSPFYMGDYITEEYNANVIDMVAKGNKVGLIIRQYKRHGVHYDNFLSGQDFFVPVFDIPEDVIDWSCDLEGVFPSVRMDVSGLFKEYYSKTLFKGKPVSSIQSYNNTWVNTKSLSMGTYTKAIHLSRRGQVARIYFTELHPEIFDFKSEVERSKLT